MYKVQYLNTTTWIDLSCGYCEQISIVQANNYASADPNKRIRVVYSEGARESVVYMP